MNRFPLLPTFIITFIVIVGCIELGKLMWLALEPYNTNEKDGMISVISVSIVGLLSFLLAFTFGIVSDRHVARKSLVREEANQLATVWSRSDFMTGEDGLATRKLLKEYLDIRISLLNSAGKEKIAKSVDDAEKIHDKLWALAISHSRSDPEFKLGSLYFDSLNKLADIHGLRIAIAYRGHLPTGLWISLYTLLVCAMVSVGYYAGSIQSKISFASVLLACSFSLAVAIIQNIDQLRNKHFEISQQPLLDLEKRIAGR